ncbi:hypothetical protein F7725_006398, partial [Dissostichus mawsoni]
MERMEVDQCAGAAGGALRSDGMTVFSPVSSARYRRSSVSINPSSQLSVCWSCSSSLSLVLSDRRQTRPQEAVLPWFQSQDSGVTPNLPFSHQEVQTSSQCYCESPGTNSTQEE